MLWNQDRHWLWSNVAIKSRWFIFPKNYATSHTEVKKSGPDIRKQLEMFRSGTGWESGTKWQKETTEDNLTNNSPAPITPQGRTMLLLKTTASQLRPSLSWASSASKETELVGAIKEQMPENVSRRLWQLMIQIGRCQIFYFLFHPSRTLPRCVKSFKDGGRRPEWVCSRSELHPTFGFGSFKTIKAEYS